MHTDTLAVVGTSFLFIGDDYAHFMSTYYYLVANNTPGIHFAGGRFWWLIYQGKE